MSLDGMLSSKRTKSSRFVKNVLYGAIFSTGLYAGTPQPNNAIFTPSNSSYAIPQIVTYAQTPEYLGVSKPYLHESTYFSVPQDDFELWVPPEINMTGMSRSAMGGAYGRMWMNTGRLEYDHSLDAQTVKEVKFHEIQHWLHPELSEEQIRLRVIYLLGPARARLHMEMGMQGAR